MTGTLLVTPATARAIDGAGALVVLVGGYDGSGNFGDIALMHAALRVVGGLGPTVLALPVIERVHRDAHDEPEHVLHYDAQGTPGDDLVPFAAPPVFGALYLYGGGYLNASWGPRKLAMVRAALAALPATTFLSSGLQADPDWIAHLDAADRQLLSRFAPFGVRDPLSADALAPLGPIEATGDDAVAVLPQSTGRERQRRVNVHIADHGWVTADPGAMEQRWIAALEAMEKPFVVQPLIAYDDGVTSERPALERFIAACDGRGLSIAEPLLLRPKGLEQAAEQIESATLTLSCSYHVALTSLLLGVPAELASDNGYYEQKAAGLREDFVAPTEAAALRERALAVRARRARAEARLITRLAAAIVEDARRRLRGHAAEAVELRAQLAQLRVELQAYERQSTDPWLHADARVHVEQAYAAAGAAREARAAESARRRELEAKIERLERQLEVVYGSRSWRLTAPLRATRSGRRRSTL